MNAKIIQSSLNGVYIIESSVFSDERGIFIKTFHSEFFKTNEFQTNFKEEYYSISYKNVIRGMHFQIPPFDHEKIVYCVAGKVLDVVLDLRKSSNTFGQFFSIELKGCDGKNIYIPKGFAHGFCALEDHSIMIYKVSSIYSLEHDTGIRWNSFNFNWPVSNPIISVRDKAFPAFESFKNPF